jgi:glycerol-3-phosphate dehydrogenase
MPAIFAYAFSGQLPSLSPKITRLKREFMYDLLIIGGGINGVGIARDAAGRGLKVLLCEQHDLAQHTSSNSSKLIHGGLRYLEYYEFGLVRKALQEREVLMRAAPHIIWPLRFIMPHVSHLRPKWMIRAGLFLYDNLAKRTLLAGSNSIKFAKHTAGKPLKKSFKDGFEYSDGWVYDARLVVLNAMDAREHGAQIWPHTQLISAQRHSDHWAATLRNSQGQTIEVAAKVVVNAAGPWAVDLLEHRLQTPTKRALRQIKGSHIIVRKMFDHPYAYIFQNKDNRIVFVIPYEDDFTLIGTTDIEYTGDVANVSISTQETDYLCTLVNEYFETSIAPSDVVSSYAGVRPLLADEHGNPAEVTRDYQLILDNDNGAPVLSIFGGKITTYRRLAEDAMTELARVLPMSETAWTAHKPLPGGDIANADFEAFVLAQQAQYSWLDSKLLRRFARLYGTRMHVFLAQKNQMADLGEMICPNLYAAEIDYLREHEWASCAQDILWRRTKLGLYATPDDVSRLSDYLRN